MRKISLMVVTLLAIFTAVKPVFSQDQAVDFSAGNARIYRAFDGNRLTPPSQETPRIIVEGFLLSRGQTPGTLSTLVPEGENLVVRSDVRNFRFGQEMGGLKVYGTYLKAGINGSGEMVSLIENLASPTPAGIIPATIGPQDALTAVLNSYYPGRVIPVQAIGAAGNTTTFMAAGFRSEDPTVTRVAVPMAGGAIHEGFLVVTWDDDNILRHTVVGRGGAILLEELRTNNDRYNIFPEDPVKSPQRIVSGPGNGNEQSPSGWVASNTTIGNNADAYLDQDNNNQPDPVGRPVSDTKDFLASAVLSADPSIVPNPLVAVQNLFYLVNVIHDKLYQHGFTEAAGNFQTNNFDKGGSGNDPVNAEAQDGGGTNNANFATPSDGSRPRMQMYVWTYSSPRRDGDLDSDVVWHEYGHGLTWRMIGSMSGPLAGAIGEGMSDVLSILANNDDVVGEYSYNNAGGIRRYPYTDYPLTYGDVSGFSVHNDGEIYAAAIWRLWELWQESGLSQDALYDALVGGMNFTPSGPAFEDMRDGILTYLEDSTQAGYCEIWQAFAQFGIGVGAEGSTKGGGPFGGGKVTITESFSVPSSCATGGGNTSPTVTISSPADNASFNEGTALTFTGTASDIQDGNLNPGLTWTSDKDGNIGTGASFSTDMLLAGNHRITASVTDSGGLVGSDSINISITSNSGSGISLTASGYKVKGLQKVDLAWSGASGADVDVYRNDALTATTPNDGAYTDNINQKGAGTYNYKVCESGSATACSNTVTVIF